MHLSSYYLGLNIFPCSGGGGEKVEGEKLWGRSRRRGDKETCVGTCDRGSQTQHENQREA